MIVETTTDLWRAIGRDTVPSAYRFGTWRRVPPSETLRRVAPLLRQAGITRVADITGLDWVGIPVHQAIRPNSRNFAVSMGKGLTHAQAKASAVMESLELLHAEEVAAPVVRDTVGRMRGRIGYDPYALSLTTPSSLIDETELDWVEATDLWTGAATWVPKLLCELDFTVRERLYVPLFVASSNGLASGNTVTEALVHGLCEVIERDCRHRFEAVEAAPERAINPATVTAALARRLLDRLTGAGMTVRMADLTGPTGLPCVGVLLDDGEAPVVFGGAGCHPHRVVTLVRALTEAAQSRAGYIAGSRDDLVRHHYAEPGAGGRPPAGAHWPPGADRTFRQLPDLRLDATADGLREIVRRVRDQTGMSPMAVDLRRPELGIPVVFVVAPGLRRPTEDG